MRTRAVAFTVLLIIGALVPLGASPVLGAPGSEPSSSFLAAGWAAVDPVTGVEHFRNVIASGPRRGTALLEVSVTEFGPTACPGGEDGIRWVDGGGSGTGVISLRPNLKAVSLRGRADLTTTTWVFCGESGEQDTTHVGWVDVSVDLVGVGPRWREASGGSAGFASVFNNHWRSWAFGRNGQGSFTIAGVQRPALFGDFGLVSSQTHVDPGLESSLRPALFGRSLVGVSRPLLAQGSDVGSMLRGEAIWERGTEDGYEGVYLGADKIRGEGTELFYASYATQAITCSDGSTSFVETVGAGQAPGALTTKGHLAKAQAHGTLDIAEVTTDFCTGESTMTVTPAVSVALQLTASGRTFRGHDWALRHVPAQSQDRYRVAMTAREAAGSITIGTHRFAPTSWGRIMRTTWQSHASVPR